MAEPTSPTRFHDLPLPTLGESLAVTTSPSRSAPIRPRHRAHAHYVDHVIVRIFVFAIALVLLGGSITNAEPIATDTIELIDFDAIATAPVVTIVEPIRQLISPALPPAAVLSPRLHVTPLFRPPRA